MIKKSVAVFAVLLLMSSSLSANIIAYEDCYEAAFDAMDYADSLDMSSGTIAMYGEIAYCDCEPNCYLE